MAPLFLFHLHSSLKLVSFIMRHLNPTDRVIILYLFCLSIHCLIRATFITDAWYHLLFNVIACLTVIILAQVHHQKPFSVYGRLHILYPVLFYLLLYVQATMLRNALIPFDLDQKVMAWDLAIFGKEWYLTLPVSMNLFWLEFFHGAYFMYYVSVILFASLAYKTQQPLVELYMFTLTTTAIIHEWFIILFPSSGPVLFRDWIIPHGIVFIPLMNFIYSYDQGGGSFPSLHCAAAVVVTTFGARLFPQCRIPLLLFLIAVLLSTVICAFHYPIDTLVGTITGLICLQFIPKLYLATGLNNEL